MGIIVNTGNPTTSFCEKIEPPGVRGDERMNKNLTIQSSNNRNFY